MKRLKKSFACFLALCILLTCAAVSYADDSDFDIEKYSKYEKLFDIDIDTDSDVAFIETNTAVSKLAFQHKYESEYSYSYIQSDIIVIDYSRSSRFPVIRTWITYNADKAQNIDSVTFKYDGKTYTFTGIGDKERVTKEENGYRERLLIRYGTDNADFFIAVSVGSVGYLQKINQNDANAKAPEMTMILHGDEDIEATVPADFWTDFGLLVLPFMSNDYAWVHYIGENDGTPCKVTE